MGQQATSTSDTEQANEYALPNIHHGANRMLSCLSAIQDDFTIRRLKQAGVPIGGRFLELGAGIGSIAVWLADQAGPNGFVVATDIDPRHIRKHDGVTVLTHDIATQDPPPGPWDLIHARLLLAHLPSRRDIVRRLVDSLAPGGALVVQEWGATGPGMVLCSSDPDLPRLYDRYQHALLATFAGQGNDPSWCWRVPSVMAESGLVDIDTTTHAQGWRGNTAGALLPISVVDLLRERLIQYGISDPELDTLCGRLTNPNVLLVGNLLWSHIGHKPEVVR